MKDEKTWVAKIRKSKGLGEIRVQAEDYARARRKVMKKLGFEGLSEEGKKRGRKRKYGV